MDFKPVIIQQSPQTKIRAAVIEYGRTSSGLMVFRVLCYEGVICTEQRTTNDAAEAQRTADRWLEFCKQQPAAAVTDTVAGLQVS